MAARAEQKHPHVAAAERYAKAVASGKIPACEWVRAACRRHLSDLKAAKAGTLPYVFDPDRAERPCKFIELLPLTKGKWAAKGERFLLQDWQSFLTVVLFGWLRPDGTRRFRRAFILIPRKNGKSEWAAAIGLYMLLADGEFGAEVYSGATTEKQAWFVFGAARQMALREPKLASAFGLSVMASNLHVLPKNAKFEPIIGNPGDGASPHCAIHDEYHEHDTDVQVDAMQTGMGAREQPLQLIITTAGDNIAGPCYQAQLEAQKVLSGVLDNDELFACIWGIDKGDDWASVESIIKANPNLGVSVSLEFLQSQLANALAQPRKAGVYKTKHLNVWVTARDAYFPLQEWLASGSPELRLSDFVGCRCYMGLDLASKIDIASLVLLFECEPDDDGKEQFAVFARHYLPSATVEKTENEHYHGWRSQLGHNGGPAWDDELDDDERTPLNAQFPPAPVLTVTEGAMIDFDQIEADILAFSKAFEVGCVAYDPHQATQLITHLMAKGVPVLEFRPTVLNFSDPMKEIQALMFEHRIAHDGDPVLAWMVSNVTAKMDAKDNVYPRKESVENKIDGVIALISAYGAMKVAPEAEESVYEKRGLVSVEIEGA